MKILHTSDWHLGRSLHQADLTPAFQLWIDHVVDTVRAHEVDALLISGDVYDTSTPSGSIVELFSTALRRLTELTTVIAISGNHDSAQRLGFGADLFKDSLHIRTKSVDCGIPVPVYTKNGTLGALVYPIPYLDPYMEKNALAHALEQHAIMLPNEEEGASKRHNSPISHKAPEHNRTPENNKASTPECTGIVAENPPSVMAENNTQPRIQGNHPSVMKAALELIKKDCEEGEFSGENVARIVMAHAFVTGAQSSESERDISVGGIDNVPSSLFRLGDTEGVGPLSYIALGHLHSPQKVGVKGDPPMRYSGSPIAFSFTETVQKSSALLTFDGSQLTDTTLIPAPVWRPIRTIEGTLESILDAKNQAYRDAFARIIVTDSSRPPHLIPLIHQAFPHALDIHYRSSTQAHMASINPSIYNPLDIIMDFMKETGGRNLTPEEKELLSCVWDNVKAGEE
ncbi:exonuclease SbcCD subunit D [Actinotignum urinale]|uniref:Nuclease SbcCD subunit D n=1 Tax=Actinotignum urinale TaxID=190146 RepID=A0AAW9HUA9_9ACTO|nr:exonuclease SbcCD subunit D C-terminal domain-containing protein [Actinotignum urinale]MDY5155229.1 exonuclease SbcCD subunit D C-terminal domain-containing protein [Actinotignum urinale]